MTEREEAIALLRRAVLSGDDRALREHLVASSNLPGPRANIELAEALADGFAELSLSDRASGDRLLDIALDWCGVGPEQAPAGDPKEYLPFCGALGLGAVGSQPHLAEAAWRGVAHAAADVRWRAREAAAMAIRRLLHEDPHHAWITLERWAEQGGWLLLRAVAAGVAHPDVVAEPEAAAAALALHRRILRRVEAAADRRSPEFRTLRQGLGYTLSVVTAAVPDAGFELLERMARSGDRDLAWVVRSNLTKKRLARPHPGEVERVRAAFGPTAPGR